MKLTICGNEFVLIVMGVFTSFRRRSSFKDKFTWKFQESLSLDYKRPKIGQNSLEAPTWRNVMFNRARSRGMGKFMHALRCEKSLLCKHVFQLSKFGQLCTAVCTNTYCISCIYYGFRSLKWCNALCAQLFGFKKFQKGIPFNSM
jgi:hypothetical protein